MSNQSSPKQGPTSQADESQLPSGQCRYILLHPDIKGLRCACVTFTLSKATPNASCACGHLACFHADKTEPVVTDAREFEHLKNRLQEMEKDRELLRQRVEVLESRLDRDHEMVARVSELEEMVDRSKEEVSQEIKVSYRNLTRAWHSIGDLERQNKINDERFHLLDGHLHRIDNEQERLGQRQLELVDADIAMEVRLDDLEDAQDRRLTHGRRRRKSLSDSVTTSNSPAPLGRRRRSFESPAASLAAPSGPTSAPMTTVIPLRSAAPNPVAPWTVHISLMPNSSQPFPYERTTNAYKRCLSRGLHQVVAINGYDVESFVSAVSRAFGSLLRGRSWMPLQAQPCTAEQLVGLPMIRPLEPNLMHGRYDADFLRRYCAVRDANGNIESLYIALTSESLSWHFLRLAPIYLVGLEDSWVYEEHLDSNDTLDDDEDDDAPRRSAGDMLSLNSLKRAASEMSRSSSFGSAAAAAEGEGSRPKVPRVLAMPNIVEVRRGVRSS